MLRSPRLPVVLAGLAVLASSGVARAQSGATLSPDRLSYMVNKDLAGERWTINLNLSSAAPQTFLNATGNVFKPDGSPPVFVLCQIRADSDGDLADPSSTFRFTCQGADACPTTATECARTGWSVISADVPIPAGFFLPPGGNGAVSRASAAGDDVRHGFTAIALARARALWSRVERWLADPAEIARLAPRDAWAGLESRGATLTYDGFNYLVNKDLGGERWSISLNLVPVRNEDGTFRDEIASLTGNVFKPDGSPPSFLHCTVRPDSTGTLDDQGSTFRFSCDGASACDGTAADCAASAWTLVGDDVALPASFLLPPGGLPASPQSDPEVVVIGRTSDPPSIISTDFVLTEAAASATAATIAGTCPVDAGCAVRVGGCSGVAGKVVQTDQGACGCRLDDVPASCITCGSGATGTCGGGCAFPVGTRGVTARGLCLPFEAGDGACACYAIGAGRKIALQSCGGTVAADCPGQRCCVDDPRDGCDAEGGVDCPGVCVFGAGGSCPDPSPDCVDASGDYSGTNRVDGTCSGPQGTGPQGISIPISSADASTFTIVQSGCSFSARTNGDTFATGTVSGNRLTATGTPRSFEIRGCSSASSSQELAGTLVGDRLELDGTITSSASCEFGEVSCSLDTSVSASR
jgi:hypothetical protein